MTLYDARGGQRWFRPTLRLRLTLLNGVLLVGGALVLLLLAWLLVGHALGTAAPLPEGTRFVEAGTGADADIGAWREALLAEARRDVLLWGLLAVVVVGIAGVAGAYAAAG